jgi:two-component system, cell cycle sensor histidine kinase and response regulator CckA
MQMLPAAGENPQNLGSLFDAHNQAILDALSEGIAYCRVIYDADGTPVDWEYIAANQALRNLLGGIDVVGRTATTTLPGLADGSHSLLEGMKQVTATGRAASLEYYAPRIGKWVRVTGSVTSPGYILAVVADVTDQKRTDLVMQRKDVWLDALTDYPLWLDSSGRILEVTESACRRLGYSREELLNMTIFDLDPAILVDDGRAAEEQQAEIWASDRQRGSFIRQTRHRSKGGEQVPVEISSSFVTIDGVEFQCVLCRDISERLQLEDSLHSMQRAVDDAPDMIHWMDSSGRTLYANRAICEALGYTPEEFLGLYIWDVDVEVTPELFAERFPRGREQGTLFLETTLAAKDGRQIRVEMSALYTMAQGQDLAISFFRDVTEHHKMEASLRTTQKTVDQSPDMVHWTDPQSKIHYVNKATADFLGYSREELETLHLWHITPDVAPETADQVWAESVSRSPFIHESTWLTKDGSPRSVEITTYAVTVQDRPLAINYGRDISERKRAEQALKESEELYRRLFNIESDAVFLVDVESIRILDANEAASELYGYSRDELLGMSLTDLSTEPESTARTLTDELTNVPLRMHRRKDGTLFPIEARGRRFEWKGRPVFMTALRDITERKRAEDALQESQRMLRLVLDTVPQHIGWKNTELQYMGCNTAFAADAGLPDPEAVVGLTQDELPLLGLPESCKHDDLEVISTGLPKLQYEEAFTPPGLPPRIVRSNKVPLRDRDGRIFGVLGVHEDVTERRRVFAALREREEQLRQSQKMEAIGRLAGGIAHDFNNVVTTIVGYSDLLLAAPGAGPDSIVDDIKEIRAAAERARTLTRQILAFSRRQALDPRVLSLNDVIGDTERLLARTIGADIDLRVESAPELGLVEIDEHEFVQALLNLAVNARDAMPSGGTLTLRTSNVELSEEFCETHPDARPGSHILVSMTDSGVGMDEETAAQIFEPFYTTKPPGQGTGLGLSMVYGVVAQSGGCTYVESELGHGTTFYIYLPRHDSPATDGRRTIPAVLVVDDDPTFRKVTIRILEKKGFRVLAANSGDQAIQVLSDKRQAIDLLLTDVVLPGPLQGIHVAERATSLRPGLPTIYMSAYSRDSIVKAGRLGEGQDYLEKPFTAEQLVARIREMLHD